MSKKFVYDIPTRFFHWFFAILFLGAFSIAKFLDDDSFAYPYHMLIGLTLGFIVILRIFWGFVGSKYARFSSFDLKPTALIQYFLGIFTSKPPKHLGHNPASSWAAILMMLLSLGLAATGVLMAQGIDKDVYEDFHEIFANSFIVVAIAHVLGVALHTIKYRQAIGLSMLSGFKRQASEESGIERSHAFVGILFLIFLIGFGYYLSQNYDRNTRSLDFIGLHLTLGEADEASD